MYHICVDIKILNADRFLSKNQTAIMLLLQRKGHKMKNRDITFGLLLIVLAAYLIMNKLGVVPHIPVLKIIISVILAGILIRGIIRVDFGAIFLPLALIACQYDEYLHIEALTPWTVILAALLLTIGCESIFKTKNRHFSFVTIDTGKKDNIVVDSDAVEINDEK